MNSKLVCLTFICVFLAHEVSTCLRYDTPHLGGPKTHGGKSGLLLAPPCKEFNSKLCFLRLRWKWLARRCSCRRTRNPPATGFPKAGPVFGRVEIARFCKSKGCLAFNVFTARQVLNPEQCHPCASMKSPANNFFLRSQN